MDEKELIRFYSFGFQNFPNHQSVTYGLQKLNCNVQARALEYMNSRNDYTVQDIAAYCHMSESGIYAMFQRLCGKTPIEMKHQILSERAAAALYKI